MPTHLGVSEVAIPNNETTEGLRQMGIPIVLIDRRVGTPMGFDCVLVDNHGGARRAIEYLVALGHRRIGLISGPLESTPGRERHEGAVSALQKAGIEQEPDLIQIGDFRTPGGYRAALRLLALSRPPTAIFAANNMMTVGALRAFHDTRVRVPGELSFVGFDDLLLGELLEPGLTCVDRPMEEPGALAMRLLLGSLDGRQASEPRQIIMETTLKVRGSCGPPRGRGVVRFGDDSGGADAAAPGPALVRLHHQQNLSVALLRQFRRGARPRSM